MLRRGRTTLVVEALVFDVDDDGSDRGRVDGRAAAPVAWASMTFAVLPGRDANPIARRAVRELPVRWAFTGAGLDGPVTDVLCRLGRRRRRRVWLSMPVRAVPAQLVRRRAGRSHGPARRGGRRRGAGRGTGLGGPAVVTDLQVAYLALGRVGPIGVPARDARCRAPDGRTGARWSSCSTQGADGRLTTVVNVRAATGRVADRGHRVTATMSGGRRRDRAGRPTATRVSEYFRLERWEIPPPSGGERLLEIGGRAPMDAHQRGPAGGFAPAAC